jgi:pyridoxine/pyridoxamine 5'-phosphate oxidase
MKIYLDPLFHFHYWMKEAHEAGIMEPEAMVLSTPARFASTTG